MHPLFCHCHCNFMSPAPPPRHAAAPVHVPLPRCPAPFPSPPRHQSLPITPRPSPHLVSTPVPTLFSLLQAPAPPALPFVRLIDGLLCLVISLALLTYGGSALHEGIREGRAFWSISFWTGATARAGDRVVDMEMGTGTNMGTGAGAEMR